MAEVERDALENQKWFVYNLKIVKIVVLLAESLIRRSVSGAELREGVHLEVKSRLREEFANREMFLKSAKLAWSRYLVNKTDAKAISTLKEQNTLFVLASPISCAVIPNVVIPAECGPSKYAMLGDVEDRTTSKLVEFEEKEHVRINRLLCNSPESCCARRRKVPESISKAVE